MENRKARILVVDDEPDVVASLKHSLSLKGYDVMTAFNGQEALDVLEREKADLILLDIMMSGLKGGEVARIVKEKYPHIKIIVVTGYSHEVEDLSKERLLDAAFIKPVNIQELYDKLVETLNQKEITTADSGAKQGIKAMVILIKAKLLFIEPFEDVFKFFKVHFKDLARRGQDYELEQAKSENEIMAKISSFNPDIIIENSEFLKKCDASLQGEIASKNLLYKEAIVYNFGSERNTRNIEIKNLITAVETACLKNGLIEIKWTEI